ncbi:TIGR02453 family protein [Sphaerisporangium melleum]|uniref:TIGR02453 family protein n=1 Tax=Sphaerisporangium melleum TaxID=321316 RepID=A0A917RQN1_9ACTN|nr:DUF2461 domain-containing protein [Sphaerisporangium melleum]GGL20535.1 TIGR02453 family protein [Sphaerisporangium melleum]GII73064.1 TIGR02453 family protein [Sphaerisporangium melleum]
MGFRGFPDEALIFYEGLEGENSKAYWAERKEVYEAAVRAPMQALMDELAGEFGPGHLFRPHRDVRFARDKSPYKTHQGAYVRAGGEGLGYYVQVDADGLYAAAGWYAAAPDQLERFRGAVGDDKAGARLAEIVEGLRAAGLAIEGDRLKTRPRGVAEDHPRLDLLRHRTLHAGRRWTPEGWLHTPEALDRVRRTWRSLGSLVGWLTENVGPSELPRRGR